MVIAVRAEFVTKDIAVSLRQLKRRGYVDRYLSSNSAASLRKHFLHFLQAKICYSGIRTGRVSCGVGRGIPFLAPSATCAIPVLGGIRRSRTISGLCRRISGKFFD